jgi:hypothetical protein
VLCINQNQTGKYTMKFSKIVAAAAMACGAAGSYAVPVTVVGSTFDITYDDSVLGLFGTPTLVGNVIEWFPSGSPGFSAQTGAGFVLTNSTFSVDLSAHAGYQLASLSLTEAGDYFYFGGAGSGVAVGGQLRVTPQPGSTVNQAIANPTFTANALFDINPKNWATSAAPVTFAAGTTAAHASVENLLAAFAQGPGLSYAFIEKKEAFLTVGVIPVPEPQTYAMMLAGLGVVGFVGRRRRRRG